MQEIDDKLPPHSIEAERGVLGCVMLTPATAISEAMGIFGCRSEVFYSLQNRTIWEVLVLMHQHNGPSIDVITLIAELRKRGQLEGVGGPAYIASLPDATPSAANLIHYAEILWDAYSQRRVNEICTEAARAAFSQERPAISIIADTETRFRQIQSPQVRIVDARAGALRLADDLEARFERHKSGQMTGIRTGLWRLDRATDGLQEGELMVIGARPSQGKTSIGLQIAGHTALNLEVPTLFVTAEMSIEALMRRLACNFCDIHSYSARSGSFTAGEFDALTKFYVSISRKPIYFLDAINGIDAAEVCANISRMCLQYGIKVVVLDYLQKFRPAVRNEKRTYEIGDTSNRFKAQAVRSRVSMVALAQLNREIEKDGKRKYPRISDLADSAQIERDADVIGLLHAQSETETALVLAKNRDGALDLIDMNFDGRYFRFTIPNQSGPNE